MNRFKKALLSAGLGALASTMVFVIPIFLIALFPGMLAAYEGDDAASRSAGILLTLSPLIFIAATFYLSIMVGWFAWRKPSTILIPLVGTVLLFAVGSLVFIVRRPSAPWYFSLVMGILLSVIACTGLWVAWKVLKNN